MSEIEELAEEAIRKEYFCDKCGWKTDCDHCGAQNTAFDCCECPADSYKDGYKVGAKTLMSLPLSERLNGDEKERIKAEYDNTYPLDPDCDCARMRRFDKRKKQE